MAKFNLNDKRDHLAIQTRLDWIGNNLRMNEPSWVWEGALTIFEEDCGLSRGFINVKNFPTFLPGNYRLTVHDLRYRLSIENNQPTGQQMKRWITRLVPILAVVVILQVLGVLWRDSVQFLKSLPVPLEQQVAPQEEAVPTKLPTNR